MIKAGIYTQLAPVCFGSGTISQAGTICKELGITKAMLITDKGILDIGHHTKVVKSLEEAGLECFVWGESKGDCPVDSIVGAAAVARHENVNGIIGLGGGSSMDTAKAVAVIAPNSDEILNDIPTYLMGGKQYQNKPLKNVLIPTTSGTGSESTFVAVITDQTLDCKIGLPSSPSFAIVDPELAVGAPSFITAFSGLDAFSHANEALTGLDHTPHSDLLAYEAIRMIYKWLPVACNDINNLEARENLALGSNFAGIAFSEAKVHVGHAIAHRLGHLYKMPHGVACAIVTPAVIEYSAKYYPEKIKKIGKAMEIEVPEGDSKQVGITVANAFRELMKEVGIPSLEKNGVMREAFMNFAEPIAEDPLCKQFAGPIEKENIVTILKNTYDHYK